MIHKLCRQISKIVLHLFVLSLARSLWRTIAIFVFCFGGGLFIVIVVLIVRNYSVSGI